MLVPSFALLGTTSAHADFTNGTFEAGTTGWTVKGFTNYGISSLPPQKLSDLNLQASDGNATFSTATGQSSLSGPDGPESNSRIRIPFAGKMSGHVNATSSQRMSSQRTTAISQTITTSAADVDPADGKVHVYIQLAPVLEDPGHEPSAQPYFFVEAVNETTGKTVFSMFNYSNQPGVQWRTANPFLYTDWQQLHVPGEGITPGDAITVRIVGAACAYGGHSGDVYVDDITTRGKAGLLINATGPASARPGDTISYSYAYSNNSANDTSDDVVTVVAPQVLKNGSSQTLDLAFMRVSSTGAACQTPAVGAPGTVVCQVGALAAHQRGSLVIDWKIPSDASVTQPTNIVGHGNYRIEAGGALTATGSLVQTTLLDARAPSTDLQAALTVSKDVLAPDEEFDYQARFTNNGPADVAEAPVTQVIGNVTLGNWRCTATPPAACSAASGSGSLSNLRLTLPKGASVTLTQQATAGAVGPVANQVSIAAPAGVSETLYANNRAEAPAKVVPTVELAAQLALASPPEAPGAPMAYRATFTNAGPSDAVAAPVTQVATNFTPGAWRCLATAPAACSAASGNGPLDGLMLTLPRGASVLIEQDATAGAAGDIANEVAIAAPTGVAEANTANNRATARGSVVTTVDLGVQLASQAAATTPGSAVHFTATLTNAGPSPAVGATLSQSVLNMVPGAWRCVAVPPAACSASSGRGPLTGLTVDLPPGGSITIEQDASAGSTGELRNELSIAASAGTLETALLNNRATATSIVGQAMAVPTLGPWMLSLLALLLPAVAPRKRRARQSA